MPGMLLHEGNRFLHGLHGEGVDLDPIQDAALIAAGEAAGLDPGIGKVPRPVMAEEDHAAHGRHRLPLVAAHEPQGLQIAVVECTQRCKRLGSRSEVEVFRAEPRQGLLVETLPPGETPQLLDQLSIGASVGGAHPHIHGCGTGCQHLRLPTGQVLELRHETGADPVADEVGKSLLLIQRVSHGAYVAAAICHPDQQGAAGSVVEGYDRY